MFTLKNIRNVPVAEKYVWGRGEIDKRIVLFSSSELYPTLIGAQIAFIPLIPSLTLGLPCGVWHMLRGECPTIIFMCFITQQLRRSPVCLKKEKSIDLAIFRHATMSVHCLPSTFINFNIPVPPACLVTKHVCIYNLYIKQVKCYMTVCCISLAVHFLPVLSKSKMSVVVTHICEWNTSVARFPANQITWLSPLAQTDVYLYLATRVRLSNCILFFYRKWRRFPSWPCDYQFDNAVC